MKERAVYFLFTDTGTNLAKLINFFTKQSLNHVSISFDHELQEVYSFGRKKPRNPFIGGFVKEDIRSDFLKKSSCAVYVYRITEEEYQCIIDEINKVEQCRDRYKYNFIGLLGVLLQIEINRDYAMFCSQFVAYVMRDVQKFQIDKPMCFITPADIRTHEGLKLVYEGKLAGYQHLPVSGQKGAQRKREREIPPPAKSSFVLQLSRKVKEIVLG